MGIYLCIALLAALIVFLDNCRDDDIKEIKKTLEEIKNVKPL